MVVISMSLLGTMLGVFVTYASISEVSSLNHSRIMRISMLNTMSLTFIFSILVITTTGSQLLAMILPVFIMTNSMVRFSQKFSKLDVVEGLLTSIMSASMGVMLIGMFSRAAVWALESFLVLSEILLLASIARPKRRQ
ncbi:hypothetical protein [Alicyclobacillus sp. SO9]|uniref:hypothetical protein n=1 Tax=Alicyclobacillus sp. SO9 TaxID=2665646 RepID=UPI0018E728D6|nr:hypothetical protein [Alicyclobacillus sp. SO9]QQE78460.1 hypothetical protein GI364_21735 [Alicyclobacillus sp. SO9]